MLLPSRRRLPRHDEKQPSHAVRHGCHKANKGDGEDSHSAVPVVEEKVDPLLRRRSALPSRTRGRRGGIAYVVEEEETEWSKVRIF